MAQPQEIHVGDVGSIFKVTIYDGANIVDLSGVTDIDIIFKKPDKTTVTKTGLLFSDGTDGIVSYTTVEGDLDSAGTWKLQVKVTFAEGSWWSNIVEFTVYRNLI